MSARGEEDKQAMKNKACKHHSSRKTCPCVLGRISEAFALLVGKTVECSMLSGIISENSENRSLIINEGSGGLSCFRGKSSL